MGYESYNDYELVYLVREDNSEANEILFNKYAPIITSYSNQYSKYIKNIGLEVNDLIQEGMLGLNNAISTFNEDKDVLFYTYAITCIKRTIITAIVKANRQKNRPLNNSISFENDLDLSENDKLLYDNSYNPEYIIENNENIEDLNKIARKVLSELELQVFDLRINNFSYNEIAILLSKSPKAIDSTIQRIKLKLKKALDEKNN